MAKWRNQWASWRLELGRFDVIVTYKPVRWKRRWGIARRDSIDD